MEMATTATGAPEQRESREQDKAGKSKIGVVNPDEPQSPVAAKRLRKGKGKLFNHVERIVKDLVDDGTVKASAQPVVIVGREIPAPPLAMFGHDDDDGAGSVAPGPHSGFWAFYPERPSNQRRARD